MKVTGLTPTQTSTATKFTISGILPYTSYQCTLSFINVLGEGPDTQFNFLTGQDGKWYSVCDSIWYYYAVFNKLYKIM